MTGGEHVVMIQCVILIRSLVITGHGQYQLQYQSNWIPSDKLWYNRFIQFDQIHKSFRLCTKDVSNKQVDNVQRASKAANSFILSPYIMILCCCCSAGKLMIRLYLETFQHYKDSHLDSYPVSHLQTVKSWLRQYLGVTNLDFCWYYETSLMTEWKLIKYKL